MENKYRIIDTHAHYDDEAYDEDRAEVLKQIKEAGVEQLMNIACSKKSIETTNNLTLEYDFIYGALGIHPSDADDYNEEVRADIISKVKSNKKILAIGEIGLDYYWNKENKQNQKSAFIKQIEIANELELPIVIHTREAISDTIDILKNQITVVNKGIFHCCPLNLDLIREGLKLGFYISFAGPITFKNSKNATEAISLVPLDRILVETDSPYLAPEPKRGTRNDSSNLIYTLQKIADVKQMSMEEVAKITYENTKNILKINTN